MRVLPVASLLLAASLPASAQVAPLTLPEASQKASVSQTVGLTEIAITYHRPAVNKRKVWGGLVPYGEVWRAGANENTVISFSTPVTVGGQKLAAGKYGLHVLPAEKDWTIIFSNESGAWGSFSYDQKEDATRVTATPQAADFQERMGYTFDDPAADRVTAALRWEKLRVPFEIRVDTTDVVVASLRQQLRGLPRFFWQGWNQAAAYCLQHDVNLDEALKWSDESLKINQNFANLRTKANLLEKKGDSKTAAELREKAMKIATENEVNNAGYQALGAGKTDEALELFKKNVKDHPDSWNVYDSLAEGLAAKGDKAGSIAQYTRALGMVKDEAQKKRIQAAIAAQK